MVNDFNEKLKDLLYESIDYLIMIAIVAAVVVIIGWRLDILFHKDGVNPPTRVVENELEVEDESKDIATGQNEDNDQEEANENEKDDENTVDKEDDQKDDRDSAGDNVDRPNPSDEVQSRMVTVDIPEGTLPSGIGSILEASGLISSKNDFVLKAQEMGLDRNLRSGKYEIPNNSSLEEIVKIIANKN